MMGCVCMVLQQVEVCDVLVCVECIGLCPALLCGTYSRVVVCLCKCLALQCVCLVWEMYGGGVLVVVVSVSVCV